MKNFLLISCALLVLLAGPSWGQQHEVTGATQSNIIFTQLEGTDSTSLSLSGEYDYVLTEYLQLGALLRYSGYNSGSGTFHTVALQVGPVFNWGDDLKSAVFFSPKAGFNYAKGSGISDGNFEGSVVAGKRFPLTESVTYKPSVGYSFYRYESYHVHRYTVTPLAFSLIF